MLKNFRSSRRSAGSSAAPVSPVRHLDLIVGKRRLQGDNELGATIGTAWIDDARLNPFQLAEGRAPESANEAVVDRATVTDEGWTIGDTFTVLAKTGPVELTLVGEATFGEIEGIPGSTMIATDLEHRPGAVR